MVFRLIYIFCWCCLLCSLLQSSFLLALRLIFGMPPCIGLLKLLSFPFSLLRWFALFNILSYEMLNFPCLRIHSEPGVFPWFALFPILPYERGYSLAWIFKIVMLSILPFEMVCIVFNSPLRDGLQQQICWSLFSHVVSWVFRLSFSLLGWVLRFQFSLLIWDVPLTIFLTSRLIEFLLALIWWVMAIYTSHPPLFRRFALFPILPLDHDSLLSWFYLFFHYWFLSIA